MKEDNEDDDIERNHLLNDSSISPSLEENPSPKKKERISIFLSKSIDEENPKNRLLPSSLPRSHTLPPSRLYDLTPEEAAQFNNLLAIICCYFCLGLPFAFANFIFAFKDPHCMRQTGGPSLQFSMKTYLLVDASSSLLLLSLLILTAYSLHQQRYNLLTIAYLSFLVVGGFFVIWSILGMVLLWGKMSSRKGVCQGWSYAYLSVMFACRILTGMALVPRANNNNQPC